MILSSADILRILGGSEIIRLSSALQIVDNKPPISGREGLFIYISRFPSLEEFEATWTLWVESDGSEPDDLVIAELKRLLPRVKVTDGLMVSITTTDIRSESTQSAPEAPVAQTAQVDLSGYEERFQALTEAVQDQMLLITSGAPGKDGKDGRDGIDGTDGRDLIATEANLEDLQNVEQEIEKQKGQVLTWDGTKWTNLFVPQVISSLSDKAKKLPNGSYVNQPLTWNGTSWVPGSEIQLDVSNTVDPSEGGLTWEQDEHTAVLGINGIHAHLGHDLFFWVRNDTADTITKGTAVMFVGSLGNSSRLLVAPMVSDGTYPGYVFLGVAAEDIGPGVDGNIYAQGKIKGVDTSNFTEGSILWCDPTVPGGLTETEPNAPNLKLPIAAVISSKINGVIVVRAKTGERLQDLHDVDLTTPNNGDVLGWNTANNRWEPTSVSGGIGEAPLDGQAYLRQNATWVPNTSVPVNVTNNSINELNDVNVPAAQAGDGLIYDGVQWAAGGDFNGGSF